MKHTLSAVLAGLMLLSAAGCGAARPAAAAGAGQAVSGPITVVTRESGSGTRNAFDGLLGLADNAAAGAQTAVTDQSTDEVRAAVSGSLRAIGYLSSGALDGTVKAVRINGAAVTAENIRSKVYPLAHPFCVVTSGTPTGAAADFISFLLSREGQKLIADSGYVRMNDDAPAFRSSGVRGRLRIGGSSSVAPVMETLAEAYRRLNDGVSIHIETTDSASGVRGVRAGTLDIGLVSRRLQGSETSLYAQVVALDGVAVIVNPKNAVESLTLDQLREIYTGQIADWSALR